MSTTELASLLRPTKERCEQALIRSDQIGLIYGRDVDPLLRYIEAGALHEPKNYGCEGCDWLPTDRDLGKSLVVLHSAHRLEAQLAALRGETQ
jgi:hypothetical protein